MTSIRRTNVAPPPSVSAPTKTEPTAAAPSAPTQVDAFGKPAATQAPVSTPIASSNWAAFDERPTATDLARRIRDLVSGPTGRRDEKAILSLLAEAKAADGGVPAVLYELKLFSLGLVDKLVLDVADRSVRDRFSRGPSESVEKLWSALGLPGTPPKNHGDAETALRKQALTLASRDNADVRAYATARLRRTDGPVRAFGLELDRLEPRSPATGERLGEKVMSAMLRAVDQGPLASLTATLTRTYDPSTKEELAKVLAAKPVTGKSGQPVSLGDVTVMVNGTFNMLPSAAMVFRAAQHSGAVVLAAANSNGPDGQKLRPLTEIRGVPVPPELKGKIWGIGNFEPTFMTWPQGSDLLLEQLQAVSTQFASMQAQNPALAGKASLEASQTTLVGFSSGALSAASARARLETAGKPGIVDRVVTIAGALGGSPFADTVDTASDVGDPNRDTAAVKAAPLVGRLLQTLEPEVGRAVFESTDPGHVASWREELGLQRSHVDLAYTASTDGARGPGRSKVEPLFRINSALLDRVPGQHGGNDGMVYDDPDAYALRVVKDPEAKTHLLEWKDPATLDVILHALGETA